VQNFPICNDNPGHKMSKEVVHAMLLIKKAAALTNKDLMAADPKSDEFKKFSPELADQIVDAVDTILAKFDWFYELVNALFYKSHRYDGPSQVPFYWPFQVTLLPYNCYEAQNTAIKKQFWDDPE